MTRTSKADTNCDFVRIRGRSSSRCWSKSWCCRCCGICGKGCKSRESCGRRWCRERNRWRRSSLTHCPPIHWIGNSCHTPSSTAEPVISQVTEMVWRSLIRSLLLSPVSHSCLLPFLLPFHSVAVQITVCAVKDSHASANPFVHLSDDTCIRHVVQHYSPASVWTNPRPQLQTFQGKDVSPTESYQTDPNSHFVAEPQFCSL